MKRYCTAAISLFIILAMAISASAASGYVADGLAARYAGSDYNGKVWTDLSGKGNSIEVLIDGNNKFTNGAYLNSANRVAFPQALVDIIASDEWTLEVVFGDIESTGTSWNTFVNTKEKDGAVNDSFSLFRHVGNDNLVLKNVRADGENTRPIAAVGLADLKNSTVTVTFKVGGDCVIYVNGKEEAKTQPTGAINATDLYFGHDGAEKSHNTEFKGFRFYSRALTAAEVTQNYNEDKKAPATDPETDPAPKTETAPQTSDYGFVAVITAFVALSVGFVTIKKARR